MANIQGCGRRNRKQAGMEGGEEDFIQENYYYLCEAEAGAEEQRLDEYEAEERFTPELVTPQHAFVANRNRSHGGQEENDAFAVMLEREARVLEFLIQEGLA